MKGKWIIVSQICTCIKSIETNLFNSTIIPATEIFVINLFYSDSPGVLINFN